MREASGSRRSGSTRGGSAKRDPPHGPGVRSGCASLTSIERTHDGEQLRRGEAAARPVPADFDALRREIGKVIVGHDEIVDGTLTALIAGGHVLLEGVPGLGKTLLVRTLADALHLKFQRIQFTPDLMPADLIGTNVVLETPEGRPAVRVPARAGLRQPRAGRRDQPGHAQDAVGPARGDAGAVGHGRRQDAHAGAGRSSCWRRRTRSRWRAPTRCPRPSSTASSSSCWSSSRRPRRWRRSSTARPRRPSPQAEPVFDGERIVELSQLARQIPIADELRRYGIALVLATHPENAHWPPR